MKKLLLLTACLGLIITSGCAGTSSCAGPGLFSGFQNGSFSDGPVRRQIRSWFQGDECSTCNAPAGQMNFGSNVAPLCESCGNPYPLANGQIQQPIYSGEISQGGQLGGQLYDNPVLNAPVYGNTIPFDTGTSVQGNVGPIIDGAITSDPGVLPPSGF